jgi:uncharacterized phage protein (TIGR01671 family)
MKKEIKFRAWDKQNDCWYKPIHEAYKGNLFELLVGFGGDLSAHTIQGLVHESMWPDRFELMQFTGLKDRLGKEIYEGDIIRSDRPGVFTGEVCYDPQMAGFVIKWKEDYWRVHRYAYFNVTSGGEDSFSCDFMEVIGNIYENPELLNEKQ